MNNTAYVTYETTSCLPPNCLASALRQTSASARNMSTGTLRLHPVHATAAYDDDLQCIPIRMILSTASAPAAYATYM